jgi:hypothetical protein
MPQALRYKSLGETGGLAEVKNLRPGTRVIYAASPESTAMSAPAGQRNSVFTAALLKSIGEKHATFEDIINRAAELTLAATNKKQYPWSSGNLGMSFKVVPQLPANPLSQERADTLPLSRLTEKKSPNSSCQEISEQTIVNGVSTWNQEVHK